MHPISKVVYNKKTHESDREGLACAERAESRAVPNHIRPGGPAFRDELFRVFKAVTSCAITASR